MKHASLGVTDSGGIQEETTILGTPCVTVREKHERPVYGRRAEPIRLPGTKTDTIKGAIRRQFGAGRGENGRAKERDGRAAVRIIDTLVRRDYEKTSSRLALVPHRCAA